MSLYEDVLLDIAQAARFLQVSESSLRRWTNAGLLASLRVGRKRDRRFRRSDLLAFMEDRPARRDPHSYAAGAGRGAVVSEIDVAASGHFCGVYSGPESGAQQAAAFLMDGLALGSMCLLMTEPSTRELVLKHLDAARGGSRGETEGRVVVADFADSAQAQQDQLDSLFGAAARTGARSLCVVGDPSAGLLTRGKSFADVIEYEHVYDREVARRFSSVTLCQYDVRRLTSAQVLSVVAFHAKTLATSSALEGMRPQAPGLRDSLAG